MGDASILEDETLRLIIRELLVSRSTESSFWQFPLQQSLYALDLGESQSILRPAAVKKQGSPTNLLIWKARALCQVHFKIGQGIKKYVAMQDVANFHRARASKPFEVGRSRCCWTRILRTIFTPRMLLAIILRSWSRGPA